MFPPNQHLEVCDPPSLVLTAEHLASSPGLNPVTHSSLVCPPSFPSQPPSPPGHPPLCASAASPWPVGSERAHAPSSRMLLVLPFPAPVVGCSTCSPSQPHAHSTPSSQVLPTLPFQALCFQHPEYPDAPPHSPSQPGAPHAPLPSPVPAL